MADVFLSYKRDDRVLASKLVSALRGAGLDVWWDQDIPASEPWEATIERELENALTVLVCWSSASVKSESVRAEARWARSRGKLVQTFIAPCEPPLFFGERQGIDLTGWTGDSADLRLRALADTLRSRQATARMEPGSPERQPLSLADRPRGQRKRIQNRILLPTAMAGMAVIGGALWWLRPAAASVPSVAVVSQQPLTSDISTAVASDLNSLADVQASAFHMSADGDHADYRIRIVVPPNTPNSSQVSLIGGNGHDILWSSSIEAPPGAPEALRSLTSAKVGQVLNCALAPPGLQVLQPTEQRLFLGACDEADEVASQRRLAALLELTRHNPRFAQGWAALALVHAQMSLFGGTEQDRASHAAAAKQSLSRARALDPSLVDEALAEELLLPDDALLERLAVIDHGLVANPNSASLQVERDYALERLGRLNEGVSSLAQAARLDPLSPTVAAQYAVGLMNAGDSKAGLDALELIERKWPDTPSAREARFYYERAFGDGRKALALFRAGKTQFGGNTPWGPLPTIEALADPSPAKVARAIDWISAGAAKDMASVPLRVQGLVMLGATGKVRQILAVPGALASLRSNTDLLFPVFMRPLHNDPSFMRIAAELGLVDAWKKSGVWPDFCSDVRLPYDCKAEVAKLGRVSP